MSIWEYFWAIIILFSIISFTYLSVKIIYKGLNEVKEMFTTLDK